MFAELIDDPATCGHWLINLNNYKDLAPYSYLLGLELEEPNHIMLKLRVL